MTDRHRGRGKAVPCLGLGPALCSDVGAAVPGLRLQPASPETSLSLSVSPAPASLFTPLLLFLLPPHVTWTLSPSSLCLQGHRPRAVAIRSWETQHTARRAAAATPWRARRKGHAGCHRACAV